MGNGQSPKIPVQAWHEIPVQHLLASTLPFQNTVLSWQDPFIQRGGFWKIIIQCLRVLLPWRCHDHAHSYKGKHLIRTGIQFQTHQFYLSYRGWFPSQLSRQGWGHVSSTLWWWTGLSGSWAQSHPGSWHPACHQTWRSSHCYPPGVQQSSW